MGRWANKYVIGLTGNIAMGKSVVRKMLEHLGAYTIDADGLAHQTMAPGAPAYHPIIETFGRWVLDPDGRINRQKLAAVAFSHPDALALLEAITHPVVRQAIDVLLSRAPQPVAVVEAIKLVEGPLAEQVDSVWVVDAAPQLQVERLMQKRGMTENEARKRMETQNPQRDKLARADAVITNNGSLQDVWVQVEREWRRLMAAFGLAVADTDTALRTVRVSPSRPPTGQYPAVKPSTGQLATPRPPTGPLGRPVVTPSQTQTMQQVQPPSQRPSTGPLGPLPALKPKPQTQTQTMPPTAPASAPVAVPAASVAPAATPPAPATPVMPVTPVAPSSTQAQTASAPAEISVDIRRGMPRHAEAIAELISTLTGKSLSRSDVMGLFGEKSYLLAETSGRLLGLAGFQVENLITRVDEFLLVKDAPITAIARALIEAVEDASKALQSEVGFVFLPADAPPALLAAFTASGYTHTELDEIKVPAWREAAAESQPDGARILAKKLRAERVLKPL